jgi:hypothetical protein
MIIEPKHCKRKKYNLNDHYFDEINSQEKAYYLGWLISDGWVESDRITKDKSGKFCKWHSNRIHLKLQIKDKTVIYNFKKAIEFDGKIIERTNSRNSNKNNTVEIYFTSYIMKKVLKRYGIIPKKSGYEKFPRISEKYLPGLISGLFGGDGGIGIVRDKRVKDKRLGYRLKSDFCGSYRLLFELRKHLLCNGVLNSEKTIYREGKTGLLYRMCLTKSETLNLYNWIKKAKAPFLKRKENVIKKFLKYFKNKPEIKSWHQRNITLTDVKTGKKYKFDRAVDASKFVGYAYNAGISTAILRNQKLIKGRYTYKVGKLKIL